MDGTYAIDMVDELDWVNPVGEAISGAVKETLDAAGPASPAIRNFLHGTWLGHALHPVLTDIPLGAWTVAAVLDTAETFGVKSVADGADSAIAIGLAGAAGAAITGLADWHVLQEGSKAKKVGTIHALLNISGTLLYAGSLLLRKTKYRGLARLFAAAGYGFVGTSAFLGGVLVTEQKIGVDHAPREGFPEGWVEALAESSLIDGKAVYAKAGDIEIAIVKKGHQLYALANACSHLGGPLCEGEVSGNGIVCPWHQSKFDLSSGEVLEGPATVRQPAFDVRIRDGKVEVKVSARQPIAAYSAN